MAYTSIRSIVNWILSEYIFSICHVTYHLEPNSKIQVIISDLSGIDEM